MTPLRLPATLVLGPELDSAAQRVRSGEVQLDWSDVREASSEALRVLLAGCDMADDADALGLSSLGVDLTEVVVDTLVNGGRGQRPQPTRSVHAPPSAYDAGSGDVSQPASLLAAPTEWQLRDRLQELVLGDLLGPSNGAEEEVDEDRVTDRYLVGMLAPGGEHMQGDADDALATGTDDATEDGPSDKDTVGPSTMFPSSFGLSFVVDASETQICVTARWGHYERTLSVYTTTKTDTPKMVWKRIPVEGQVVIDLKDGPIESVVPCPEHLSVIIRGRTRQSDAGWMVTLFLVNGQQGGRRQNNGNYLFQAELQVEGVDGRAVFLPRPMHEPGASVDLSTRQEDQSAAMLYQRQLDFAVGHGVGVHADQAEDLSDRAIRLCTRVVPEHDVPITDQPTAEEVPLLPEIQLDMKVLSELDGHSIQAALWALPRAYGDWIETLRERIHSPDADLVAFGDAPERAVEACERARERIAAGIDLLTHDEQALESFRFANHAMWQQRVRTIVAESTRRGAKITVEEVDLPKNRSWRLFQLAFILLNLPGITCLDHPDRAPGPDATADLLWFPTGGGKTEAYLGLTAYTLGLRRLQGTVGGYDGGHGVAVLMRYTLRLLTLQQFQRAAALICACERIRLDAWYDGDTRWGEEPFRIGLWVGNRTTPNRLEDASEAIKRDRGSGGFASRGSGGGGTPAQLTNCPWCGHRINPGQDIKVDSFGSGHGRVLTYCGDPMGLCPFTEKRSDGEGLPVMVVDEEIYRYLPSLLISTVDKFAQMPWRGETQMLFGRVNGMCERHGFRSPDIDDKDRHPARGLLPAARTVTATQIRPPDLIIQDELHLISGPLGTLVGAYETAIDELSTWEVDGRRIRPKVIASTATVRRAEEQIRGLFLRTVEIFPPQGLTVADNFFSRQRVSDPDHPGRRYIGICAPGRRLKAALIRVYVAYLAASQLLYKQYGGAADPWMTLVGYFNSMRELGGMRRVVDDDVRSRLRRTNEHGLEIRRSHHIEELTSRKSSTDIPEVLDLLEQRFDPASDADRAERRKRGVRGMPTPIDVLLATNMLSVGVDVQRLGLMVVAGQPKQTAEYIQATSRVGRRHPGLICTVYNWTRPRDLSHYERFEHYHGTFYQQVEALSVTPFSSRALDRSLSALLVSLVRLQSPDLNGTLMAGHMRADHPLVQRAVDVITERAMGVSGRTEVRDQVRQELGRLVDRWVSQVKGTVGGARLGYTGERDGVTVGLLQAPDAEDWTDFTCLQSLRDVEPEVGLVLDDYGMDNEPPHLRDRVSLIDDVEVERITQPESVT